MASNRTNRFERHPVLTLTILLCLAIAAIAAAFRYYYHTRLAPIQEEDLLAAAFTFREASPFFHHGLSKNQTVDDVPWGPLRYAIRTNSLGFRDSRVRDVPLRTNGYRILLMGDSFTEGVGLDYEDTFAGILAADLADKGVEVLNAGAVSYSPIIYWRKTKYLIETVGLEFDEMVVFLDISDARDEVESYYLDDAGSVQSRLFEKRATRKKILDRIHRDKIVNSLGRYLALLLDFSTGPAWETGRWTLDPKLLEEYGRPGLSRMTDYMDRLHELLKSRGIKLTVAVYPWPVQIREGDRESIQARHWSDWCRGHQVEFIDYFPVFITPDGQSSQAMIDRYFIPGDSHWNRAGHALIARVLEERFETGFTESSPRRRISVHAAE